MTKKVEDKTKAEEYWLSAQDDFGREALARKIRGVFRFRYRHKSPHVVQVQF